MFVRIHLEDKVRWAFPFPLIYPLSFLRRAGGGGSDCAQLCRTCRIAQHVALKRGGCDPQRVPRPPKPGTPTTRNPWRVLVMGFVGVTIRLDSV